MTERRGTHVSGARIVAHRALTADEVVSYREDGRKLLGMFNDDPDAIWLTRYAAYVRDLEDDAVLASVSPSDVPGWSFARGPVNPVNASEIEWEPSR